MDKNKILKMKEWMFEITGDWNVFLFNGEGLVEAYKATVEEYKKTKNRLIIPSPPLNLEEIKQIKF